MKPCVLIPCYNHPATVAAVAKAALEHCPVLVVDDGSTTPLPELPGCAIFKLEKNGGKGAALRAGFKHATEMGFTHAITMDADGQHFAEDLPGFLAVAQAQPEALAVGVRDFYASGCPAGRRRSNAVSTFWFRIETGVPLGDSQCGFRGYPLELTQQLRTRSGGYAFELEFMVRASWVGRAIVAVPVKCSYAPEQLRLSHFRPILDLAHITIMNIGLVFQSWTVPRVLRKAWSFGEKQPLRKTISAFFVEHAHDPWRVSLAVGLGLFFGIAPFWGYQMVAAATAAHFFRLNKAITLVASNISMPPMVPFIVYGGMFIGHWIVTGHRLEAGFSPHQVTRANLAGYFGQWLIGSLALAVMVAVVGTLVTYIIALLFRKK